MSSRTTFLTLLSLVSCVSWLPAQPPAKLPLTGLAPAKLVPNLCVLKYRISTNSAECQNYFDQGLGYYYSYVWMEAARSFETATHYDPSCALAWWGLSRAIDQWKKGDATKPLQKANELLKNASHREQLLITARMQEKGLAPNVGDSEARKKAAILTLDTLLSLYEEDEEAWYFRAQLAAGGQLFGGAVGSVPFYKALLRINPLHPGANHELVHYYETSQRPALGWIYSENYIKSSPGIPHPWHMQSHLATRLGRWEKSSESSGRGIQLQQAYHKEMNIKPNEDSQYSHHAEVLMLSLVHDGRFQEARTLKEELTKNNIRHWMPWFRLHYSERDWVEANKVVENYRKSDKPTANYLAALIYLAQNDLGKALTEINALEEAYKTRKTDKQLRLRLLETRGTLLCQLGLGELGLPLLQTCVKETVNDYRHHAWGNGAYYMEVWGKAALRVGNYTVTEEAFLEAMAHDSGSVRGALGMQVLSELKGCGDEALQYADLAKRFWRKADPHCLEGELSHLRKWASGSERSMK